MISFHNHDPILEPPPPPQCFHFFRFTKLICCCTHYFQLITLVPSSFFEYVVFHNFIKHQDNPFVQAFFLTYITRYRWRFFRFQCGRIFDVVKFNKVTSSETPHCFDTTTFGEWICMWLEMKIFSPHADIGSHSTKLLKHILENLTRGVCMA